MSATQPTPSKVQVWITAMRPRTLLLALACIFMGSFLAAADNQLRWAVALLCALTTIFLQILSNLANDYGDTVHGADSKERAGPKRATQQGLITRSEMWRAILITAGLSMISGLILLYIAFGLEQMVWILIFVGLGAAAIWAAIAYTATSNPYGYMGLGDLFVLIFFGWVGTIGTYFVQTGDWRLDLFLPATSVGLLAVAVLNVNNVRDIESDRTAGKRSIPVRLGLEMARQYHWTLLTSSLLCAILFTLLNYHSPWQWLFLVTAPMLWRNGRTVSTRPPSELDPMLKQTAIMTLIFVVTFGVGLIVAA